VPFTHPDPSTRRQPIQVFLAGGAVLCVLAAVVLLLQQPDAALLPLHRGMAAGCVVAAAVFAWFSRSAAPLAVVDRALVASVIGIALVVTLAWNLGTGLRTIALGMVPLLVGLSTLLAGGWRAGVVTAVAAAGLALLAWRDEQVGREAIIAAWSRLSLNSGLWSHAVLLLGGLVFGLVAHGLVQRWRSLADAREHHFRDLLASAADRYIEIDADLRFAPPTVDIPMPAGPLPPGFIGCHPWEAPGLRFDPDQARAHRADLMAHRPFDIEVDSQPDPQRAVERLAISGRPRWSGNGQFLGYWCVGRDITAKERQRVAAEQAAADAEAASRAKSSFLANMSHEIRTPLNGILGLARLARLHADQQERLVDYLALISESAEALNLTLSNVLDLSRAEAGRLEVSPERLDLPALLHELQRSFAALCRARGLVCSLHIAPDLPQHVQTDAVRLRQILTNYLHNALKFTTSGGIGLVALVVDGQRLRFEVHDSGCGIADSDQARLFQPFSQVDATAQRRHGGSGLGLSICRELAQAMGGQVGLVSQVGQGSRFWLELPLLPDTGPAPDARQVDEQLLAGLRVLVAEDNPVNMMITVALLEGWGVQVDQVVDGLAAVAAVAAAHPTRRPFDLVLMDLQMPDLDGLSATRRMRALGVRTPVVAFTATVVDRVWADAREAGFDEVLAKPVDAGQLHALLLRVGSARSAPSGPVSMPAGSGTGH